MFTGGFPSRRRHCQPIFLMRGAGTCLRSPLMSGRSRIRLWRADWGCRALTLQSQRPHAPHHPAWGRGGGGKGCSGASDLENQGCESQHTLVLELSTEVFRSGEASPTLAPVSKTPSTLCRQERPVFLETAREEQPLEAESGGQLRAQEGCGPGRSRSHSQPSALGDRVLWLKPQTQ